MKEAEKQVEEPLSSGNPKLIFLSDTGLPPEKAFCMDENPDRNNFAFDETYWKNVPKFRRPPKWILGPHNKWGSSKRKLDPRYFEALTELSTMKRCPGIRINPPEDLVPFGRNYLPLPEDGVPETHVETSVENDAFRARTTQFNEKLRQNPKDISLWLDFLHFQDEFARNAFNTGEKSGEKPGEFSSKSSRTGLIERKVAIIERAIENNSGNLDLKIRRLNMCEDVWEKEQLSSEWRKLAFTHPNNPYVWSAFLNFFKSNFSLFQVSKMNKLFQKYMTVSRSIQDGSFQSHAAVAGHSDHMITFAGFFATFWMQSGHQEKATGFLQALLEINLNFPENLDANIPLKNALVFFEPFWDSNVPRFGMKNSQGWGVVMERKSQIPPGEQETSQFEEEENTLIKSGSSTVDLWIKLERFRQERFLLPYTGSEDPTDPERIILFDDISPLLFKIPHEPTNEHVLFSMVMNFLMILRCPLNRSYSTRSYVWRATIPLLLDYPLVSFFGSWSESHLSGMNSDTYSSALFQQFGSTWTDEDQTVTAIFEQSSRHFKGKNREESII